MRYRKLGGTGIEVSVHCLGIMMFGAAGNPDHNDCIRIIHAALDQGINFVDTALYSPDSAWRPPALMDAAKRRRLHADRAARDGL